MANSKCVRIETLQPIESRGWIVAKVGAGTWDLRREGTVDVVSRSGRARMRYAGFGEAGGERLLTLVPLPGESISVTEIVAALGGTNPHNAFIERVPDSAPSILAQVGASRAQ